MEVLTAIPTKVWIVSRKTWWISTARLTSTTRSTCTPGSKRWSLNSSIWARNRWRIVRIQILIASTWRISISQPTNSYPSQKNSTKIYRDFWLATTTNSSTLRDTATKTTSLPTHFSKAVNYFATAGTIPSKRCSMTSRETKWWQLWTCTQFPWYLKSSLIRATIHIRSTTSKSFSSGTWWNTSKKSTDNSMISKTNV